MLSLLHKLTVLVIMLRLNLYIPSWDLVLNNTHFTRMMFIMIMFHAHAL